MGTILIVSKKKGDVQKIQNCFGSEAKIDVAFTNNDAIEILRKKRHDYVFIDMGILGESVQDNNYTATLESLPTAAQLIMPAAYITAASSITRIHLKTAAPSTSIYAQMASLLEIQS